MFHSLVHFLIITSATTRKNIDKLTDTDHNNAPQSTTPTSMLPRIFLIAATIIPAVDSTCSKVNVFSNKVNGATFDESITMTLQQGLVQGKNWYTDGEYTLVWERHGCDVMFVSGCEHLNPTVMGNFTNT